MRNSTIWASLPLKPIKKLSAAAFWVAVWQLAAFFVGKELLLPGPLRVLSALAAMAGEGSFWQAVLATVLRIFTGGAAGVALGLILAALTSRYGAADALLSPLVRTIRATPVASFIILALVWLKTGILPGFISMLMVMPVVWANVCEGIAAVDGDLLELARAYRFSRTKTLRLIYIPSVKPYFSSAMATGLGMAWKSGVAAEVLCQPKLAVGTGLYFSKIYLETPELFAWTAVIVILSFLLEGALVRLIRRI